MLVAKTLLDFSSSYIVCVIAYSVIVFSKNYDEEDS